MALNIRNQEVEEVVRKLTERTGETSTQAVTNALKQRLTRERIKRLNESVAEQLKEISKRCSSRTVYDDIDADEIPVVKRSDS